MVRAGKVLAPQMRERYMASFAVNQLPAASRALIRTWRGCVAPRSPFAAYHQGHMTANADKAVRPTSLAGAATG
jgi:hypothetical protein